MRGLWGSACARAWSPSSELIAETCVRILYIHVERSNMSDHEFNNFEGAVEDLARDLEILEEPVNRRLKTAQTRPRSNDVR